MNHPEPNRNRPERTERHLTNGVLAMPKVKVQSILTRNYARCTSLRESFHIFLIRPWVRRKRTILLEDESQDDDTEELYQSVFNKN